MSDMFNETFKDTIASHSKYIEVTHPEEHERKIQELDEQKHILSGSKQ